MVAPIEPQDSTGSQNDLFYLPNGNLTIVYPKSFLL